MRLRKKTLLVSGVTLILMILIIYATSQVILMDRFDELEEQNTGQNLERVLNALSDTLSDLDAFNNGWAAWDDTYEFIEDGNDEYIESNLVDETFTGANLNLMLFLNSSGRIVFGKFFDLDGGEEIPIPQSVIEHLNANNFILTHDGLWRVESGITGVILLPENPMLISSRPILTSENEGPVRGTLIMGRYLDSAEVEYLSALTRLSLAVHRIHDTEMPSDFQEACGSLSDEKSIFVQPLDRERIAGYATIKDIYGEPILMLRADVPRGIYKQGQDALRYFIISLLSIGLVFGVVSVSFLEKTVLSRMGRLGADVSRIGKSGSLSSRLSITGYDELSVLSDNINGMLAALEQYQDELDGSEQRFRSLFNAMVDPVVIVDEEGVFVEITDSVEEVTGFKKEELLGKSFLQTEIVSAESKAILAENMVKRIKGEDVAPYVIEGLTKDDGRKLFHEVNARRITYRGKPADMVIFRDVTERKRAEEALMNKHEEVERLNRLAGGGERKVVELEREVNALLKESGKEPRYEIVGESWQSRIF